MGQLKRVGDLEIGEDMTFQEREWAFEKVGWGFMAVVLLVALLGLLGPGPLSNTTIGEPEDPVSLNYERFTRYQAPTELKFYLNSSPDPDGNIRLWIERSYLEGFQIEQITPTPNETEMEPERIHYVFGTAETGQPLEVVFHMMATQFGPTTAQAGTGEEQALSFRQFVYP